MDPWCAVVVQAANCMARNQLLPSCSACLTCSGGVDQCEAAAVQAFVGLTMRLTEARFKPLFFRLLEWAHAVPAGDSGKPGSHSGRVACCHIPLNPGVLLCNNLSALPRTCRRPACGHRPAAALCVALLPGQRAG